MTGHLRLYWIRTSCKRYKYERHFYGTIISVHSFLERFVLSFSSAKILMFISFLIILSAISLVSVSAMPIKTHSPFSMLPVIFPSIVHFAWFTRCITNCKKGNRPSFVEAGSPDMANELYEYCISECDKAVPGVQRGVFGADMKIELENDGPFTIVLDSDKL